MAIAQGVSKETRFKRQSAKGALAGTSAGQVLRRETSTFDLQKEAYTTESEITKKAQITSVRHGAKLVNGSVTGIFSPGTYSDIVSAILRRDFASVTSITGLSITIAGSGPYTITRASGDFLAGGIKIGMVVRLTAGSFNSNNLNKNFLVTNVTATVLTVIVLNGSTMTAEGPIAAATVAVPGKVTYVPETGHTNIYYTIEEWYSDAAVSERNMDVRFSTAALSLPGSGNAKISLTALGLDQTDDTSAYFTSPTAETTTGALVAASGALLVNGTSQAVITDLSINIDGRGNAAGCGGRQQHPSGRVSRQGCRVWHLHRLLRGRHDPRPVPRRNADLDSVCPGRWQRGKCRLRDPHHVGGQALVQHAR
jgi:hypothetical protein